MERTGRLRADHPGPVFFYRVGLRLVSLCYPQALACDLDPPPAVAFSLY